MVAVYIVFKKKEKIHKKFYTKMESMTTGGYLHFLLKSDNVHLIWSGDLNTILVQYFNDLKPSKCQTVLNLNVS